MVPMTRTFFFALCLVLSASLAHAVVSGSDQRNKTSPFIDTIHRIADKKPENLPVLYRETLLQCARNNSAFCQLQLGKEYVRGRVFKKNMKRMRYWFKRAAFNDPSYRFELGVCYELGEGGKQDIGLAIKHYNVAAKLHSRPEAYYRLGRILEQGKGGIQKNIARALDHYMLASQLGHAQAAARAGAYFISGEGVEKDEKKALALLEFAAANNDSLGLLLLSVAYTQGDGVEIDLDKAEDLAIKARDLGEEGAEKQLEKIKANRIILEYLAKVKREVKRDQTARDILAEFQCLHKDPSAGKYENIDALEMAAEAGEADAQFLMGERLYADGNGGASEDSIAVQWLQRAAQQDHFYALCRLALLHKHDAAPASLGQLAAQLKKNLDASGLAEFFLSQMESDAALEWQEKSLAKGCAHAAMLAVRQSSRGGLEDWHNEIRFLAEAGVPHYQLLQAKLPSTDKKQAFLLCEKAAEQEYAPAQFELGEAYRNGAGVARNDKLAFQWYYSAAHQGYAAGQLLLGYCYERGLGTPQNMLQAFAWYRLAAEQGDSSAQFTLGYKYEFGEGIRKDREQAIFWYSKAAAQGHRDAKKVLVRLGVAP